MLTNTYLPFAGGVPRSISTFAGQYKKLGHQVKIVAPDYPGQVPDPDVIRVPAMQEFQGTAFSVHWPIPFYLSDFVESFRPELIHSHHPFLLGNTALRMAVHSDAPLVFTFHTFYEHYVHYFPVAEPAALKRFVTVLASRYANLCDHIIAPSRAVEKALLSHGVTKPIDVIPTGVDVDFFSSGSRERFRKNQGIPAEAFVVGFVSRLAEEKNLTFLCDAVLRFLSMDPNAWFVIAGIGPMEDELRLRFSHSSCGSRIRMTGNLEGNNLADAYQAFDVFPFASLSETQGLVVLEAMAASLPVVALRGPGVEDILRDGVNGRLLETADTREFAEALRWVADVPQALRQALRVGAQSTAVEFSDVACARKAMRLYGAARREVKALHEHKSAWEEFATTLTTEWNLLANLGLAAGEAIFETANDRAKNLEKGDSG